MAMSREDFKEFCYDPIHDNYLYEPPVPDEDDNVFCTVCDDLIDPASKEEMFDQMCAYCSQCYECGEKLAGNGECENHECKEYLQFARPDLPKPEKGGK